MVWHVAERRISLPVAMGQFNDTAGGRIDGSLNIFNNWRYDLHSKNATRLVMNNWKRYPRKGFAEARPYVVGEDVSGISVSREDEHTLSGPGGMIARNPDNHGDQWYISEAYFNKNFEKGVEIDVNKE